MRSKKTGTDRLINCSWGLVASQCFHIRYKDSWCVALMSFYPMITMKGDLEKIEAERNNFYLVCFKVGLQCLFRILNSTTNIIFRLFTCKFCEDFFVNNVVCYVVYTTAIAV